MEVLTGCRWFFFFLSAKVEDLCSYETFHILTNYDACCNSEYLTVVRASLLV